MSALVPDQTDVFISHIHKEAPVALALQSYLQDQLRKTLGCPARIFVSSDKWQRRGGEDWFKRIREELRSAKVVILLLSEESVKRPWVNFEAGAAWYSEAHIIPVCIGGLTPGSMPRPYSDLMGWQLEVDAYHLLRSVYDYLAPGGIAPIPPPPRDQTVQALQKALAELRNKTTGQTAAPLDAGCNSGESQVKRSP